jgi:hypothetical protein
MPANRAENQGDSQVVEAAPITEASSGVDLGDFKSEIGLSTFLPGHRVAHLRHPCLDQSRHKRHR